MNVSFNTHKKSFNTKHRPYHLHWCIGDFFIASICRLSLNDLKSGWFIIFDHLKVLFMDFALMKIFGLFYSILFFSRYFTVKLTDFWPAFSINHRHFKKNKWLNSRQLPTLRWFKSFTGHCFFDKSQIWPESHHVLWIKCRDLLIRIYAPK